MVYHDKHGVQVVVHGTGSDRTATLHSRTPVASAVAKLLLLLRGVHRLHIPRSRATLGICVAVDATETGHGGAMERTVD